MTIAAGLRAELIADATIAGLVGADGIWQEFAPPSEQLPYITYRRVSTASSLTLDGPETFRRIAFQIDCYADTIAEVETLKARVRAVLDGKRDTLGSESIQICYMEGETDLSDIEGDDAIRRVSLTFLIIAHEG